MKAGPRSGPAVAAALEACRANFLSLVRSVSPTAARAIIVLASVRRAEVALATPPSFFRSRQAFSKAVSIRASVSGPNILGSSFGGMTIPFKEYKRPRFAGDQLIIPRQTLRSESHSHSDAATQPPRVC